MPRLALTTAVTVPIMTWLVMPRVTRLSRRGLYPDPITQAGPDDEVEGLTCAT